MHTFICLTVSKILVLRLINMFFFFKSFVWSLLFQTTTSFIKVFDHSFIEFFLQHFPGFISLYIECSSKSYQNGILYYKPHMSGNILITLAINDDLSICKILGSVFFSFNTLKIFLCFPLPNVLLRSLMKSVLTSLNHLFFFWKLLEVFCIFDFWISLKYV